MEFHSLIYSFYFDISLNNITVTSYKIYYIIYVCRKMNKNYVMTNSAGSCKYNISYYY